MKRGKSRNSWFIFKIFIHKVQSTSNVLARGLDLYDKLAQSEKRKHK